MPGVTVTPWGVAATSGVGSPTARLFALAVGVAAASSAGAVTVSAASVTVTPAGVGVASALAGAGVLVRPPLFLLPPNADIELTPAWKTDILAGEDGTEQRVSIRDAPLESMRYQAVLGTQAQVGALTLLLARAPDARVLMPRWFDASPLTADVAIGATSISCDTTDRGFTVGGAVLLWRRSSGDNEVRTIAGLSDSAIDITGDATTRAWPSARDTLVLPVAPALLTLPFARTYVGGIVAEVTVESEWELIARSITGPAESAVAAVSIVFDGGPANNFYRPGAYWIAHAEVRDADDLEIPEAVVTWTVDDPTISTIQAVGFFGHVAIVKRVDASLVTHTVIHATSGGVTADAIVGP